MEPGPRPLKPGLQKTRLEDRGGSGRCYKPTLFSQQQASLVQPGTGWPPKGD